MEENIPILQFSHIAKRFGRMFALKDVNFSIPQNSFFGIIGPNGAGKSTLLKILIGFLEATSGDIFLKGKNVTSRSIVIKHLFGYTNQDNCLYDDLTVQENLHYFGRLYWLTTAQIENRSKELIELVGLKGHEGVLARNLSGGMQRKLDIACAIIHAPAILVLDEPIAGLDPISAHQLWKIINYIHGLGTTVIVSSHILTDLEKYCTDFIFLNKGTIIKQGTLAELRAEVTNDEEINIETNKRDYKELLTEIWSKSKITSYYVKDNKLTLYTPQTEKTLANALIYIVKKRQKIYDFDVSKPSLQEVFERYIRKQQ